MTLVLSTSENDYICIPNTEDYITKSLIAKGYNYHDQTKLVHGNGALILTLNDSLILDSTLISVISEKYLVYYGNGNNIESEELSLILDNRHAPIGNCRGENLDALFNKGKISFLSKGNSYRL